MTVGVKVLCSGDELSNDFLPLFMFLCITQVCISFSFSNDFTWIYYVFCTVIFHRRILCSFLFQLWAFNWPHPFNEFSNIYIWKMHFTMSSAKRRPFCLSLRVYNYLLLIFVGVSFEPSMVAAEWLALLAGYVGRPVMGLLLHCLGHSEKYMQPTWWRHQMETFSALLAFVRGHRSPLDSPHKG